MTENRKRTDDWDRTQWKGSTPDGPSQEDMTASDMPTAPDQPWVKTEWIGDQGEGSPGPVDRAEMPEGEEAISGDRHAPGVQDWAGGNSPDRAPLSADRPLKRS